MRQPSKKNQQFRRQIQKRLEHGEWSMGAPLPPARELSEQYAVSSSTAYRILIKLAGDGFLWQHANGRFYAAEARHLIDTVQPYACMLPRVELWSAALLEIMQGITRRSGEYKRGILLIHNAALIQQKEIDSEPAYADAATQENILREFFATHADSCEGIIFDNVWKDEVLARFPDRLKRMVVINRRTGLDFASAVYPDFDRCALLVFAHLFSRGFEKVIFVSPHDDHYIQQMMASGLAVAQQIGAAFGPGDIRTVRSPAERRKLCQTLRQSTERVGVYCPDDNWARLFKEDLTASGLSCPEQVGLLAGIGTETVRGNQPLSTLKVDFRLIGEKAVDCLREEEPTREIVPVELQQGTTT